MYLTPVSLSGFDGVRRERKFFSFLIQIGDTRTHVGVLAAWAVFSDAPYCFCCCFCFKSFTAARMASSASIEQCSLTGGRFRCFAISSFLMFTAWSTCCPLTHSVTTLELAIAEPHPNVLKHESMMLPSSSTLICSFITSPHAGAPTKPVPTFAEFLSNEPTLRGLSKWSTTFLWYPRAQVCKIRASRSPLRRCVEVRSMAIVLKDVDGVTSRTKDAPRSVI